MKGTEKGKQVLFVTDDAAYAATYSDNVTSFRVSRSGMGQLEKVDLVEPFTGTNYEALFNGKGYMVGQEYKLNSKAIVDIILKQE